VPLVSRTSRLALLALVLGACAHSKTPTPASAPAAIDAYLAGELARVAPNVSSCARYSGIVEVTFDFAQAEAAKRVRASLDCMGCRTPNYVDEAAFLRCVERAASAVRAPNPSQAPITYWYNVGAPEDERLKLGWEPGEFGSH
jgi:hypothetical protein